MVDIKYCVRRRNGTIVPLVAADELPMMPQLNHIPRNFSLDQVLSTDITLLSAATSFAPATSSVTSESTIRHSQIVPKSSSNARGRKLSLGSQTSRGAALSDSSNASTLKSQQYSQTELDEIRRQLNRGRKIWCSKWLDTRDCAFEQQGCRYKHNVPPRVLWRELGFPHGRPWWHQMAAPHHIQQTLTEIEQSQIAEEEAVDIASHTGRPRVPTIGTASSVTSDAEQVAIKTEADRLITVATLGVSSKEDQEMCLIDFDDSDATPGRSRDSSHARSPAHKKTRTDDDQSESAIAEETSPPSTRTFVPAGEDDTPHVAAARVHARRREQRGWRPARRTHR